MYIFDSDNKFDLNRIKSSWFVHFDYNLQKNNTKMTQQTRTDPNSFCLYANFN